MKAGADNSVRALVPSSHPLPSHILYCVCNSYENTSTQYTQPGRVFSIKRHVCYMCVCVRSSLIAGKLVLSFHKISFTDSLCEDSKCVCAQRAPFIACTYETAVCSTIYLF